MIRIVARSQSDGRPTWFDTEVNKWRYTDTNEIDEGIGNCRKCGKDNYIIPIDKLPLPLNEYANPKWIEGFGGIPVDYCIHKEVEKLIIRGIKTLGCCCGHYGECPVVLVSDKSKDDMIKLGYKKYEIISKCVTNPKEYVKPLHMVTDYDSEELFFVLKFDLKGD